jgi:hypothetical protein
MPSFDDQREPVGQVVAGAAVAANAAAVLAGDDAEAVVFDLVQPRVAGGWLRRLCREAWRDEVERTSACLMEPRVRPSVFSDSQRDVTADEDWGQCPDWRLCLNYTKAAQGFQSDRERASIVAWIGAARSLDRKRASAVAWIKA